MSIIDKVQDLTKKKVLTSMEVYAITKYGEPLSEEQILAKSIKSIDEMMTDKANRGFYSLVVDADPGLVDVTHKIVECYIDRGFTCFILDKEIDYRIKTPQIFISWDR